MRYAIIALFFVINASGCRAITLDNAEFTGARDRMPEGWTGNEIAAAAFSVDDAEGADDQSCLRYKSDKDLEETWIEQAVELEPETDYVLTAWFKSDGTLRPAVALHRPGERNFIAAVISDGSDTWQRRSVRFNSGPVGEAIIRVYGDRGPQGTSRAGLSYIDAITVVRADEAKAGEEPIPGGYGGPPPGENIALGKSYTWSVKPSYSLCTDEGDATQLTDGEHTVGYFWTQKSTVGWQLRTPLEITIDLEKTEPIVGVSFNTAAGVASVGWPAMIFVLTSNDGENFEYHGELIALSAEYGLPAPQRYVIHRYFTDRLRAAGRYLRLVIYPAGKFLFCDEIEVYRGDFPITEAQPGEPVESTTELYAAKRLDGIVGVRCMYDIQELRSLLRRSRASADVKADLSARLDALAEEVRAAHVTDVEFWRGLPYTDLHERIYAVNAALRRAEGYPELSVWQNNHWDNLDPMTAPEGDEARIDVPVMRGEWRSAAFNISNFTDASAVARIGISLDGIASDFITVHEVQFVQTQEREVVANALPVADIGPDGRPRIPIPAGMTKQVWLTVHPQDQPPGVYNGTIQIDVAGRILQVPLRVEIAPLQLSRPPVSVFVWDYVGDRVSYAPNFTRIDVMAQDLEEHFVDAPWAHPGILPWPEDGSIDAEGHITQPLDFGPLDRWINRFPNARLYLMFANLRSGNFKGTKRGTERWATALGEWAQAITEHLRQRGVPPDRWAMLIIDEPHSEQAEQIIVDIVRAMKATVPDLQVFEDPVRADPTQAVQEMYDVSDILCPNLPRLSAGGDRAVRFYQDLQARGKRFFIYQCSGPHKLLDPINYHRLQFWHAWNLGATGSGYWGYVDAEQTGSSWDNFKGGGTSYSLVYVDDQRLADSKQWEAVREGAEDYTYLAMLREAVAAHEGEGTPAVREARQLLETLPVQVAGEWQGGELRWADERDRSGPDRAREQILRALLRLQ